VRLQREVRHDTHPSHPFAVVLRTDPAALLRLPLGHGDRRRAVDTHESVANEAGMGVEDGNAVRVDLVEDPLCLGGLEVDVPPCGRNPQIPRHRDGVPSRRHSSRHQTGAHREAEHTCDHRAEAPHGDLRMSVHEARSRAHDAESKTREPSLPAPARSLPADLPPIPFAFYFGPTTEQRYTSSVTTRVISGLEPAAAASTASSSVN
jgi:hypothetical protein